MKEHQVCHIAYAQGKGQQTCFVQNANLIAGKGLEQDYHSQIGDDGLIVVASKPLLDWMENIGIEGLCFKRFRYNICLTESTSQFKSDDVLNIGDAEIIFSTRHKPCFAAKQYCPMPKKTCQLPLEMKFAEIQKSGTISVGNSAALKS